MKTLEWIKENTASLEGKTVAISGATGGIGRELCNYFAMLGASLILIDRNPEKSSALRRSLTSSHPALEVRSIIADLEDIASVRSAADELIESGIDCLVLNAGAYHIPRHKCSSGFDNIFQINFVSPYYLARTLLPSISERGGRVIAVGSIAHNYSKADFSDIDFSSREKHSLAYGNAKRFLMFSLFGLDEYRENIAIAHPGITFTNITAHYPKLIFALIKHPMKIIFMKPKRAALSIISALFADCGKNEWIGPRFFDVWGLPKKKLLKTASREEAEKIFLKAQEIYSEIIQ